MIAAIYARKSTEQLVAHEQKSVTRQIELARAFAARKGWTIAEAHIYSDDGISGAEFERRPGLQRLLRALQVRQPPFEVLIVSEQKSLGREMFETGFLIKQIAEAGIEVVEYVGGRSLIPRNWLEKQMSMLQGGADEAHREQSGVRVHEAHLRGVQQGHMVGGKVFGYRNVDVFAGTDTHGRPIRSHVRREVLPAQAEVVRRIFRLKAEGHGYRTIAVLLNGDAQHPPRAQQGRPSSWTPSTVRAVLFRPLYRGDVLWNRTRKRSPWGKRRQRPRPESEWQRVYDPALRIVSDEEWAAAHAMMHTARAIYAPQTGEHKPASQALKSPGKYLLSSLARCGQCGGPMKVASQKHSAVGRRFFYVCAWHHDRGAAVCGNGARLPLETAHEIVIEALLDDVLHQDVIRASIARAVELIAGNEDLREDRRRARVALAKLERERDRLVAAITAGGNIPALVKQLQEHEARIAATRTAVETDPVSDEAVATDPDEIRRAVAALATRWRQLMVEESVEMARPVVSALLQDRVTFTPIEARRWEMRGTGTLSGLFSAAVPVGVPLGLASPPGFEPGFWP